ncbi:MAG: hypothetical protein WKF94_02850 [Solirubrobacteraceae bacterium]
MTAPHIELDLLKTLSRGAGDNLVRVAESLAAGHDEAARCYRRTASPTEEAVAAGAAAATSGRRGRTWAVVNAAQAWKLLATDGLDAQVDAGRTGVLFDAVDQAGFDYAVRIVAAAGRIVAELADRKPWTLARVLDDGAALVLLPPPFRPESRLPSRRQSVPGDQTAADPMLAEAKRPLPHGTVVVSTSDVALDGILGPASTDLDAVRIAVELARDGQVAVLAAPASAATDPRVQVALRTAAADPGRVIWLATAAEEASQDLAAVSTIDNLRVLEPCSLAEVARCVAFALATSESVYLRLSRAGGGLGSPDDRLQPGRGSVLRDGSQAWLVASGPVVASMALDAAGQMTRRGISTGVIAMPWIAGIDAKWLKGLVTDAPVVCLDACGGPAVRSAAVEAALRRGAHRLVPRRDEFTSAEIAKYAEAFVRDENTRLAKAQRRVFDLTAGHMARSEEAVARARAALSSKQRIIVGPWLSEVGFEVLYWIPMVRALTEELGVEPDRIVVVSRGGPRSWYAGIADTYLDAFDAFAPAQLRALQERRSAANRSASVNSMKQLDLDVTAADRELLDGLGLPSGDDVAHLVPGHMYRRYSPYWRGVGDSGQTAHGLRFRRIEPVADIRQFGLPKRYVAVKGYFSACFPDDPINRATLERLVRRIAESTDVVLLDTTLSVDDHEDFSVAGRRIHSFADTYEPASNLELQTAIAANAAGLVTTYGGFAYLGPLLGLPTLALWSHANFNPRHLDLARAGIEQLGFEPPPFLVIDAREADSVALKAFGAG